MNEPQGTASSHNCPICGVGLPAFTRYPRYVCQTCAARVTDVAGRPLAFGNIDIAVGCVGAYTDTGEVYDAQVCYVAGQRCSVQEARFGGIVIQTLDAPGRGPSLAS